MSTNHMLDELRQTRTGPLDTTEFNERLEAIEALLRQLMDRQVQTETERPVPISPPSQSDSEASTDLDGLFPFVNLPRGPRGPIAAPRPRGPGVNFDDELLALLQAPPPQVATGVQPPPALIPFTYQPAPRPARSTSPSPPPRAQTFPLPREPEFRPEVLHTRRDPGGRRDGRRGPTRTTANVPPTETTMSPPLPTGTTRLPAGPPPVIQSRPPTGTIPPPQPILVSIAVE